MTINFLYWQDFPFWKILHKQMCLLEYGPRFLDDDCALRYLIINNYIYGFHKMHMDKQHCNSICQKTSNTATGTILSMLKIYSRCLICILKVKYTEFKDSYFTTVSSS